MNPAECPCTPGTQGGADGGGYTAKGESANEGAGGRRKGREVFQHIVYVSFFFVFIYLSMFYYYLFK